MSSCLLTHDISVPCVLLLRAASSLVARACVPLLLLLLPYLRAEEIRLSGPNTYFSSTFNWLDLLMHLSYMIVVALHLVITFYLAEVGRDCAWGVRSARGRSGLCCVRLVSRCAVRGLYGVLLSHRVAFMLSLRRTLHGFVVALAWLLRCLPLLMLTCVFARGRAGDGFPFDGHVRAAVVAGLVRQVRSDNQSRSRSVLAGLLPCRCALGCVCWRLAEALMLAWHGAGSRPVSSRTVSSSSLFLLLSCLLACVC